MSECYDRGDGLCADHPHSHTAKDHAEQIRVVDGWCPIHGSLQEVSPFKPWADSRKGVVDNYHCDVCMKDGVYTPILIATEAVRKGDA